MSVLGLGRARLAWRSPIVLLVVALAVIVAIAGWAGTLLMLQRFDGLSHAVVAARDAAETLALFEAWQHGVLWCAGAATIVWLAMMAVLALAVAAQEAARREAQQVREMMEQVFDASPVSVMIKDADLRYVWTNKAHQQRTGWSLEFLRGKRPDELAVDPKAAEAAMAHDRRVLETGRAEGPEEQLIRHSSGKTNIAQVTKVPLRRNGRITHIITTGIDVTQIRQAQSDAENARRLLEDVINNVPATIHVKGADLRYRWTNRQFAAAYGRTPAEIVGLRAQELRPDGSRLEETDRNDREVLSSGTVLGPYEAAQRNAAGDMLYLLMTKVPLRDAEGRVTQILTVSVDITARRRAEQALQRLNHELEQRVADRTADLAKANDILSKIIDGAPIPILTFDRDGRVTSFNAAAERTTGFAAAEVVGGELPTLDAPARVEFAQLAERIARSESFHGVEARRRHKDGHPIDLIVAGAPLFNAEGEPDGAIGIWLDVTEQRAVERQLQQAQKMEAVGQVTGGIAHDFNNLLSVVIGNLDMALEATSPEVATDLLRESLAAAERSAELTQRLLAFARPQIAAARLADPGAVIKGMQNMLATALGTRIRLALDLPSDGWPVEVDVPQLESSILNLCVNARDAMTDGGTLTIRVQNEAGDEQRPDRVRIDVIDTGSGMPPDVAARAFEPFFTTKQFGRGSGLGLSMVYAFVRRSGGEAALDSAPGGGTTVTLRLPRAVASAEPSTPEPPKGRPMGRGETVLVVEDNDALREMVEQQLKQLGYNPIMVANGDAGLEVLKGGAPVDLLFTDIVMPGSIDGRGLAEAALQLRPDLRCLLTSGYEHDDPATRTATAHLPLLAKPYRRDELARAVRQALDQPQAG